MRGERVSVLRHHARLETVLWIRGVSRHYLRTPLLRLKMRCFRVDSLA